MAKCGLSIELEKVDPALRGGDKVRGHVRVDADADVRCRSITVYAGFRTRGKGNVAQQLGTPVELFSGEIAAGKSLRFPFEVEVLRWPPTYNGYQFSIEHFIETTADIPWAFDPKVSTPIPVLPGETRPSDFPKPTETSGCLRAFIAVVFILMGLFTVLMMQGPNLIVFTVIPVGILLLILGLFLTFKWLPKMYVGQVEFALQSDRLSPGERLIGSFSIRPNRKIKPDFIRLRITATETCVSGSGSNTKTHRHELFQRDIILADHPELIGDKVVRYQIDTPLPPVAAYSTKLHCNELQWAAELRVGISGLVDWKQSRPLIIVPPVDTNALSRLHRASDAGRFVDPSTVIAWNEATTDEHNVNPPGGAITFEETIGHIWAVQDDDDEIEMLVDAVAGLPMDLQARIERRMLSGSANDSKMLPGEHLFWAISINPPLSLALYVPESLCADIDRAGSAIWSGHGEIVGWNRRDRRLQIRVYR